jgi:hypothetical protein
MAKNKVPTFTHIVVEEKLPGNGWSPIAVFPYMTEEDGQYRKSATQLVDKQPVGRRWFIVTNRNF